MKYLRLLLPTIVLISVSIAQPKVMGVTVDGSPQSVQK
jgi:hypothetical protein